MASFILLPHRLQTTLEDNVILFQHHNYHSSDVFETRHVLYAHECSPVGSTNDRAEYMGKVCDVHLIVTATVSYFEEESGQEGELFKDRRR